MVSHLAINKKHGKSNKNKTLMTQIIRVNADFGELIIRV